MARLAGQTDSLLLSTLSNHDLQKSHETLNLSSPAKDYAERVGKYIPAEIVAAYMAANGILESVDTEDKARIIAYISTFILCLVFTPIYFSLMSNSGQPKRIQVCVSTIAFLVWAYALGGIFSELELLLGWDIHKPWIGSLSLIFFSLVSGAIVPK